MRRKGSVAGSTETVRNDGFNDSGRTAEKCALHMQNNAALAKREKRKSALSGGCVETRLSFPIYAIISGHRMEVIHGAFHRRFGSPADDVAS